MDCTCYAGVLPPCGHACNAVVLVDQGLRSQQDLPHVQHMQQATTNSTPVDSALNTSPLQLPGKHNGTCDLGATGHTSRSTQSLHEQAASTTQCATDHTQAGLDCLSGPMLMQSAHPCMLGTDAAHLNNGVEEGPYGDTLYCGAGQSDAFLALSVDQLLALSKGQAVDLVQSGASQPNTEGSSQSRLCKTAGTGNTFLLDSMCGRLCRWLRSVHI